MTQKRRTEEQVIAVLKEAQAGVSVLDLGWKHEILPMPQHRTVCHFAWPLVDTDHVLNESRQ
jgi:nitrogen fixation protein